jgi:sugar/nucleoside kinase (ribokinase family)
LGAGSGLDGLTVVGNFAVDRVDGRAPTPGGCPSFAALALTELQHAGTILTQRAPADAALFRDAREYAGISTTILDARSTCGFELLYDGEQRTMTLTSVGDSWTPHKVAGIGTPWVHLAPLLRSDFPLATLQALRAAGHQLSYDGQGLVRAPIIGPMVVDADYDRRVLAELSVLKLADDEAEIIAAGEFTEQHARQLGVPEILITFGSAGADLYVAGSRVHVAPDRRIDGVQTTGSGDMFSVAYAAARASGTAPEAAAQTACELVAAVLARRRAGEQV